MNKVVLGKTGMEISKIFYGGIVSTDDGQENSDRYVAYAIDQGINYFDVAPTYGDAEEKLGNSLIPYRKDVYLACKTNQRTAEGAKQKLARSLELLHTDHFDVYQMHEITSVADLESTFAKGGAMEVLLKAKEEGVAKHLGVTCHSEEAAVRALELYDFDTVLFPTNWGLHMSRGFGSKIAAACAEKQVGFLGMKSMVHRAWFDQAERDGSRFPKSWCKPIFDNDPLTIAAMKYTLQNIGPCALVPPGNFENFKFAVDHIDLIEQPLTAEELAMLEAELKVIHPHYFF